MTASEHWLDRMAAFHSIIEQPWGEEYFCCGGSPDGGHVGPCGA